MVDPVLLCSLSSERCKARLDYVSKCRMIDQKIKTSQILKKSSNDDTSRPLDGNPELANLEERFEVQRHLKTSMFRAAHSAEAMIGFVVSSRLGSGVRGALLLFRFRGSTDCRGLCVYGPSGCFSHSLVGPLWFDDRFRRWSTEGSL